MTAVSSTHRTTAVIGCGSRHWTDAHFIWNVLDGLLVPGGHLTVIEGGALGADACIKSWVQAARPSDYDLRLLSVPAHWKAHGKAAGPFRNQEMLALLQATAAETKLVIGFKDDPNEILNKGGTENMIRQAWQARIPAVIISHAAEPIWYGVNPL